MIEKQALSNHVGGLIRHESTPMVPLQDIERMAIAFAKSGLFGIKTPEQALALMLIAQAEGRHPAIAARDYHIIEGRPSKKSEAILRDFLEAGGSVVWHESGDTVADATFSHPAGGRLRIGWDKDKAVQAGLWGRTTWAKYPAAMLRARVISEGIRAIYPGATSGLYAPEEVQDFGPTRNITPKQEATEPEAATPALSPSTEEAPKAPEAPPVAPTGPKAELAQELKAAVLKAVNEVFQGSKKPDLICSEAFGRPVKFTEVGKEDIADIFTAIERVKGMKP